MIVQVLNPGVSDHCPLLVDFGGVPVNHAQRFRFLTCLVEHPDFLSSVRQGWGIDEAGVPMFRVWSKLKAVRLKLAVLTQYYSKAHLRVVEARQHVDNLQTSLQLDPLNTQLFQEVTAAQLVFDKWSKVEESILQQKSKVHWLEVW